MTKSGTFTMEELGILIELVQAEVAVTISIPDSQYTADTLFALLRKLEKVKENG